MRVRDGRLITATRTSRRPAGARRQLLLCRCLAGGVRGGDRRARRLHALGRPRCLCLREGGLGDEKGGDGGGHAVVVVAAAPTSLDTLEEAERTRGGRA